MGKKRKKNITNTTIESGSNNKISGSFVLFSIVFFIIYLVNIFNDKYFQLVNDFFLTMSYISIFIYVITLINNEFNNYQLSKKIMKILHIAALISIVIIYIKAFYPYLEIIGDNAVYIARTKSLLAGEGFRNFHKPNAPYETSLYNIGFSLVMIPFVLGKLNIIFLKFLPLLSTAGALVLLYFILKQYISKNLSLIIVVLTAINEEIIHFSTLILTENVFICFMLLSIFLLIKYEKSEKAVNKNLFLSGIIVFFTFLIRFAGMIFLAVAPLYLLYKKSYKKAIILALLIIVLFSAFTGVRVLIKNKYVIAEQSEKVDKQTDADTLFKYIVYLIKDNKMFFVNIKNSALVIPQKVLDYSYKSKYEDKIIFNIILFFLFLIGIFIDLKKRMSPMSFFVLGFIAVIIIVTHLPDLMVMSRYFVPLIPFVYYFTITASIVLCKYFSQKINLKSIIYVVFIIILSFLTIGVKTTNIDIYVAKQGLSVPYMNFLEASKWAELNIPQGEIIASRKPSICYTVSGHKSDSYFYKGSKFTRYSKFSGELEKLTLEMYKKKKINYILFDTFSGDAFGKLLPIMRNYPGRFSTVIAYGGKKQKIKLPEKWWNNNNVVNQLGKYGVAVLLKYSGE